MAGEESRVVCARLGVGGAGARPHARREVRQVTARRRVVGGDADAERGVAEAGGVDTDLSLVRHLQVHRVLRVTSEREANDNPRFSVRACGVRAKCVLGEMLSAKMR